MAYETPAPQYPPGLGIVVMGNEMEMLIWFVIAVIFIRSLLVLAVFFLDEFGLFDWIFEEDGKHRRDRR